jgi:hypothetical protein
MQTAVNPQTGEVLFLIDNEWKKPEQTATNPETGERAYLINNAWEILPTAQPPAQPLAATPEQPLAEPVAQQLLTPQPVLTQQPAVSQVPEDEGFLGRNYRYAKDALLSGFESFRMGNKAEAFAISFGAMKRDEEEYGGPGVPLAPSEVKERYERNRKEAQQYGQEYAQFQSEAHKKTT